MNQSEVIQLIHQELPTLMAQDPLVRDFVLRTVSEYYADRRETDSKFDRILAELQRDREEQARKWDEESQRWHEQDRKWDEQNRKWDEDSQRWHEQNRKWDENMQQINKLIEEQRRARSQYESTIGALGSRWGLNAEASFRNALKGILEESFEVEVLNINDYDEEGEVFGRPDQVEIDVIIKNGVVILCEIKSSFSKSDMYSFDRKVAFYQKRHQRPVTRKLIISPMVDSRALPVAEKLSIEVYSYVHHIENL